MRHLHGVGAADELQQLVDEERDDEDVERVEPADVGRPPELGEAGHAALPEADVIVKRGTSWRV